MSDVSFLLTGDTSLCAQFGEEISPAVNAQVRALHLALSGGAVPGVTETVPTYRSLMIHYNPEVIRCTPLIQQLQEVLDRLDETALPPAQVLEIPVLYGGEMGPDLEFVARHSGMTPEEVVRIHTRPEYLIYMLGFTPGFTYLGGMSQEIAAPRLKNPRVRIPAGSVGIAGGQTGVYPIDSPGGWQLIGRTPVRMYDPNRPKPILPEAGQYIKFRAITPGEYDEIAAQESAGGYVCPLRPREEDRV